MNYKDKREQIQNHLDCKESVKVFLETNIGIDVTRGNFFKVRYEERTPSCLINNNGSFHDYGSGKHYSDIVSLLFDGYNAFSSLTETIKWLCSELSISWETDNE